MKIAFIEMHDGTNVTVRLYQSKWTDFLYLNTRDLADAMGIPWNTFRTKIGKVIPSYDRLRSHDVPFAPGDMPSQKKGAYIRYTTFRKLLQKEITYVELQQRIKAIDIRDTDVTSNPIKPPVSAPANIYHSDLVEKYKRTDSLILTLNNTTEYEYIKVKLTVTRGELCALEILDKLFGLVSGQLTTVVTNLCYSGVLIENIHVKHYALTNGRTRVTLTPLGLHVISQTVTFKTLLGKTTVVIQLPEG